MLRLLTSLFFIFFIVVNGNILAQPDVDDWVDDAEERSENVNIESLANRAAINAAASERGKSLARTKSDLEKDAMEKDDFKQQSKQESPEADRASGAYRRSSETRVTYEFQEDESLLQVERKVRESAGNLGETFEDCMEVPADINDYILTSERQACQATGRMETLEFECITEGFDYCSSQFLQNSTAIDTQRSLQQLGVLFYGGAADQNNMYRQTVTIDTINWDVENILVGDSCIQTEYTYRLEVPDRAFISQLLLSINSRVGFVEVQLNDQTLLQGGNNSSDCENTTVSIESESHFSESVDILNDLTDSINNVKVIYTHPSSAGYDIEISGVGNVPCDEEQTFRRSCPADITESQRLSAVMVDRECSKRLDSESNPDGIFENDCVEYTEHYRISKGPIFDEEPSCEEFREAGCRSTGSTCIEDGGSLQGFSETGCSLYELTFQCETTSVRPGAKMKTLCGDSISCFGGSCDEEDQIVEDNSEDFKESASWLTVLSGIKQDMTDPSNVRIFSGAAEKCSGISLAAFSDCCKEGGWGVDFGLASCPASEEALRLARESGRALYVGGYSEDVPVLDLIVDVELTFYNTYCVYPTKIARIFIEAANEQLNRGYGSAKNPNCSGLTPEQLAQVNLDNVDLSEYYPDAMQHADNATLPDNLGAQSRVSGSDACTFSTTGGC